MAAWIPRHLIELCCFKAPPLHIRSKMVSLTLLEYMFLFIYATSFSFRCQGKYRGKRHDCHLSVFDTCVGTRYDFVQQNYIWINLSLFDMRVHRGPLIYEPEAPISAENPLV